MKYFGKLKICMFGYIKPHVSDLLVKENAFYKSVYCGLCQEMKKKSLVLPFTLSYDFVFLCILRLAVSNDEIRISKKRCFVHPFKKKPYLCSTPSLDYGARASAMLLYRNIEDDVRDSKGFKRIAYKIALSKAKKICKKNPVDEELDRITVELLDEICRLENENCADIYACADAFGKILGNVMCHALEDPSISRPLWEIGFHVGRWIYLIDAVDDLEKDKKTNSYNPFIASGEAKKEDLIEKMDFSLALELSDANLALNLLPISDEGLLHILENILQKGMPNVAKKILYPQECQNDDKYIINQKELQ